MEDTVEELIAGLQELGIRCRCTGKLPSSTFHINLPHSPEVWHLTLRKVTYDVEDELMIGME